MVDPAGQFLDVLEMAGRAPSNLVVLASILTTEELKNCNFSQIIPLARASESTLAVVPRRCHRSGNDGRHEPPLQTRSVWRAFKFQVPEFAKRSREGAPQQ
ncbi:hypothetical protein EVAR_17575_1 [Eumeta japonica]|uniref:Uncharacterized protein n=1 Tax=Eumeta variegata TaxID=151549 RepID=A0A4C1UC48_EUMVA|nr:hypothetical protein EVAR_17575_1 [Eumeta japonica]